MVEAALVVEPLAVVDPNQSGDPPVGLPMTLVEEGAVDGVANEPVP
jgi:hypothetical protein